MDERAVRLPSAWRLRIQPSAAHQSRPVKQTSQEVTVSRHLDLHRLVRMWQLKLPLWHQEHHALSHSLQPPLSLKVFTRLATSVCESVPCTGQSCCSWYGGRAGKRWHVSNGAMDTDRLYRRTCSGHHLPHHIYRLHQVSLPQSKLLHRLNCGVSSVWDFIVHADANADADPAYYCGQEVLSMSYLPLEF